MICTIGNILKYFPKRLIMSGKTPNFAKAPKGKRAFIFEH